MKMWYLVKLRKIFEWNENMNIIIILMIRRWKCLEVINVFFLHAYETFFLVNVNIISTTNNYHNNLIKKNLWNVVMLMYGPESVFEYKYTQFRKNVKMFLFLSRTQDIFFYLLTSLIFLFCFNFFTYRHGTTLRVVVSSELVSIQCFSLFVWSETAHHHLTTNCYKYFL